MLENFWTFWIYIYIDIAVLLAFAVWGIWFYLFDTRVRLFTFYPNRQIKLSRVKPKNDVIATYDKNTETNKLYTINKKFIYFMRNRIPYAFYWDNIPIPLNMMDKNKFDKKELELIKKINKKAPIHMDIEEPSKLLKKDIEIDTAETFFRVLHTNFTLNLLKKPQDFKKAIKWTVILIGIGIALAVILHFTGVIDLGEFLGATAK